MAVRATTLTRSSTAHSSSKPTPTPGISRNGTTYSLTTRSTTSNSSSSGSSSSGGGGGSLSASSTFTYHVPTAIIPSAYEPPKTTAPAAAQKAAEKIAAVEDAKPDKSRRFLSTKLWFSNSHFDGESTVFTFASSNSTWGTLFNSLTLGLSAPLCRVYFVELLFEGRRIEGKEEVRAFLEGLRFVQWGQPTSGEELIRWLERQVVYERRRFGFEKLQGNSFAVYLLTLPRLGGSEPDTHPLRKMAEQRYRVLDCVDNIVMLGGMYLIGRRPVYRLAVFEVHPFRLDVVMRSGSTYGPRGPGDPGSWDLCEQARTRGHVHVWAKCFVRLMRVGIMLMLIGAFTRVYGDLCEHGVIMVLNGLSRVFSLLQDSVLTKENQGHGTQGLGIISYHGKLGEASLARQPQELGTDTRLSIARAKRIWGNPAWFPCRFGFGVASRRTGEPLP
ncbi:hypothetical protein C7212DRAFT_340595 [Tuber magnatum]|uniref:Uncharacterized protein n=1 Tax=Tuber magnatum TaxID=42249 RepID=A0A317SZJ9_9PEZI|nr:hypothetical protein C7212DRAFT_340595 [Tuber magnatum]